MISKLRRMRNALRKSGPCYHYFMHFISYGMQSPVCGYLRNLSDRAYAYFVFGDNWSAIGMNHKPAWQSWANDKQYGKIERCSKKLQENQMDCDIKAEFVSKRASGNALKLSVTDRFITWRKPSRLFRSACRKWLQWYGGSRSLWKSRPMISYFWRHCKCLFQKWRTRRCNQCLFLFQQSSQQHFQTSQGFLLERSKNDPSKRTNS